MRALLIATLLLSLCAGGARANDAAFIGVGGSLRPLRGEHAAVRMVREQVTIEVFGSFYRTVADFEFRNETSRAVAVTMGFPETGGGDVSAEAETARRRTTFRRFATWVDGRPTLTRRVLVSASEMDYEAYWTKQVSFAPRQTRRVRVEYESQFSGVADSFGRRAPYRFTGGNWRGQVEESLLTVRLVAPGLHGVRPLISMRESAGGMSGGEQPLAMERRGAQFSYRWTNWEAEADFSLAFMSTVPDGLGIEGLPHETEAYEEFRRADASDGRIYVTVPATGAARSAVYNVNLQPPVLRRDGRLFISVEALRSWLEGEAAEAGRQRGSDVEVSPAPYRATAATLRAGRHRLAFRVGSAVMRHNGRTVTLPAAPFQVSEYSFYVPLDDAMRALNGTARLDAGQRRVTLRAPAFW